MFYRHSLWKKSTLPKRLKRLTKLENSQHMKPKQTSEDHVPSSISPWQHLLCVAPTAMVKMTDMIRVSDDNTNYVEWGKSSTIVPRALESIDRQENLYNVLVIIVLYIPHIVGAFCKQLKYLYDHVVQRHIC